MTNDKCICENCGTDHTDIMLKCRGYRPAQAAQSSEPGLLPCPFCGSDVRCVYLAGWEVLCNNDDCGQAFELPDGRCDERAATVTAWNTRTLTPPQSAVGDYVPDFAFERTLSKLPDEVTPDLRDALRISFARGPASLRTRVTDAEKRIYADLDTLYRKSDSMAEFGEEARSYYFEKLAALAKAEKLEKGE